MSATKTIEQQDLARSELGLIVRSFGIGGVGHGKPRNGEAEAVANADVENFAGFVGNLLHFESFAENSCGRLFAEHVFACPHKIN